MFDSIVSMVKSANGRDVALTFFLFLVLLMTPIVLTTSKAQAVIQHEQVQHNRTTAEVTELSETLVRIEANQAHMTKSMDALSATVLSLHLNK